MGKTGGCLYYKCFLDPHDRILDDDFGKLLAKTDKDNFARWPRICARLYSCAGTTKTSGSPQ